jgi:hypothetical protein
MTNHRTTVGPLTTWLLTRAVGGCQHSIVITYNNRHEPRPEVARRIWRARRQLHIACEQQRDAIRQQLYYYHC